MSNSNLILGSNSVSRLRLVLLASVVGIGGGMVGFMLLEELDPLSALYMTVITLSTVGFGEVKPLHPAGRIFVIFLIFYGVAMAGSIATFIGEHLLGGQFRQLVSRRKMETKLKKMSNHFIIAGYGRVGQRVATEFRAKKVPFVVIEKNEEAIAKILDEGFVPLRGDATDDDVIQAAGIEKAHTLISTLPEEAQNVYLTLTARYMNPKLNIIARADYEQGEKKLLRAGADHVVIPHVLGGIRMAKAALQPNVVDFMQMASVDEEGLLVEEIVLPTESPLSGKTLAESELKQRYGISIIGVKKPGQKINLNPDSSTRLHGSDVLVVIGQVDELDRFSRESSPQTV